MRKSGLFLLCTAMVAVAALAAPASASAEDGAMAPAHMSVDMGVPTALPVFELVSIRLGYSNVPGHAPSLQIMPALLRFVIEFDGAPARSSFEAMSTVEKINDSETTTAEGVPKST